MRAFIDIFAMWRSTRMIVLVAVSAALYAAVLIPFKPIVLIPGIAELRPGAAIPPVCAVLFGPAGGWGAAIGNVIGDYVGGTIGPGSVAGFVGNFLFGFLPYVFWRLFGGKAPFDFTIRNIVAYVVANLIASCVCALIIAVAVQCMGLAPFKALFSIIMFNNGVFGCLLGTVLLLAVYRRVQALGLTYPDVMGRADVDETSDLDE